MTGISIKIKFSLFLAVLLLLTVLVLSVFVLNGIRDHQRDKMETELLQHSKIVNLSVKQALLTSASVGEQTFLRNRGQQLAMDLAVLTGLRVVLYDNAGRSVGDSAPLTAAYDVHEALAFALQGKIAYTREHDSVLYLSPLQGPQKQMGVILLQFSLTADMRFYDTIASLFKLTGAIVLAASFLLGYLFFSRSASAIIDLSRSAEQIRQGRYLTAPPFKRKDELGKLAQGIYYMSTEIQSSMTAMKSEALKLRQAVDKLQKLERQQKQFIGNISHEFKTPLTSIKAYVELMSMYEDDEALRKDAVERIGLETERLHDMVEKILRLSALEKYEFELHAERLDVRATLLEHIDRMQAKAGRFGTVLETRLEPAEIWADRESFGHIVVNLLDNAIKYNVPGGKVVISNRMEDEQVAITIADTGIGIPAESREKIFEPFYTANKDRSRRTGGTGLGLALVKQLVEKHRGTITLLEAETGAVFRLTFPAYRSLYEEERS